MSQALYLLLGVGKMVDFASVYNLANKPTEPFPDWAEEGKKVAQMKLLQHGAESGAMDLQQKRQSMAEAMQLKQELAGAKTPEEAMQVLYRRGRFKEAEDLGASVKSMQTAKVGFQKAMLELNDAEQKHIQTSAERIGNIARMALAKPDPQSAAEVWKSRLPEIYQDFQDTETDGPMMRNMKVAARKRIESQLPLLNNPQALKPMLQEYVDNSKKTVDWINESKPLTEIGKINMEEQRGLITKEQAEIARANAQAPKVNMAQMPLGNVSTPLEDAGEERIARLVAEGRMATPPMSRNNPRNLRIIARADSIKMENGEGEGLDATTFPTRQAAMKYFTTGKGADAFRQQDTILHHTKAFEKISNELENNNIQAANKIANQYGIQMGSDKATNYKIAAQIISSEVGKYLAGGTSTQAEREEIAHLLPMFSSPQQFKGAVNTLTLLIEGQRRAWEKQKESALGKGKPPEYKKETEEKPSGKGTQPANKPAVSNTVKSLF